MKGGVLANPEVFLKVITIVYVAIVAFGVAFSIQAFDFISLDNRLDRETLVVGNAILSTCIAEESSDYPVKALLSEEKIINEIALNPARDRNINCVNFEKSIYIEIYDENKALIYDIGDSRVCLSTNPCEKNPQTRFTIFPAALNKTSEIVPVTVKVLIDPTLITPPCFGTRTLDCAVPPLTNPGDERFWLDNNCDRVNAKIDCDGNLDSHHVCDNFGSCNLVEPSIIPYSVSDTNINVGEYFSMSVNGNCPNDLPGKCLVECRVIHPDGHFMELDTWDEDGIVTTPSIPCNQVGNYIVDYCVVVTDFYANGGWGDFDQSDTVVNCAP